jgi:hypothetical protein
MKPAKLTVIPWEQWSQLKGQLICVNEANGNGNEPVAMKKRQWTHGKEANWNGNKPMAKSSGWHGNVKHVINPVGEDRTIKARSKTYPSQAGATDSCWERNYVAEVITCTCVQIEIALKNTANSITERWVCNSTEEVEGATAQQKWWAQEGTTKMMSTQRCKEGDEHMKAQWQWARDGALMMMSAQWRNKEYDDMHATASMMTCARWQCLMIARWHKMKIGAQWRKDEDQRVMAQRWTRINWANDLDRETLNRARNRVGVTMNLRAWPWRQDDTL